MKNLLLFLTLTLSSFITFGQEVAPVEMATGMRSSGKIYVVIAVLLIIFAGLVIYLMRLDKKITKLEKEINK